MSEEAYNHATVEEAGNDDHLEDLPDGSGCTEIWEHLSARRGADDDP